MDTELEKRQRQLQELLEKKDWKHYTMGRPDQTEDVYQAEMAAWDTIDWEVENGDQVLPGFSRDNLRDFMQDAVQKLGFYGLKDANILFCLTDDDAAGGRHKWGSLYGVPDEFHFGITGVPPVSTVLHELAHFLRPNDGHGEQFCAVLIGLYYHVLDFYAAIELASVFNDFDVSICPHWLEEVAPDIELDSTQGIRRKRT